MGECALCGERRGQADDSTMAGNPFKVGRFAHTLRMRLMREHAGVDVDSIEEDQLMSREPVADEDEIETWDPDHEQEEGGLQGVTRVKKRTVGDRLMRTFGSGLSSGESLRWADWPRLTPVTKGMSENMVDNVHRAADTVIHPIAVLTSGEFAAGPENPKGEAEEREDYDMDGNKREGFADSVVPTLEERTIFERRPSATHANGEPLFDLLEEGETGTEESAPREATVPSAVKEKDTVLDEDPDASKHGVPKIRGSPSDKEEKFGAPANAVDGDDALPNKDTDRSDETKNNQMAIKARQTLRKHLSAKIGVSPWTMPTPTPKINPNRFHDPLDDTFWKDMWVATAVHNTEIFRKVFRCIPDDLVTTWAAYKAFANHAEKFNRTPEDVAQGGADEPVKVVHGGPGTHGAGGGGSGGGAVGQGMDKEKDKAAPKKDQEKSSGSAEPGSEGQGGGGKDQAATFGAPVVDPEEAQSERQPSGPNDAWAQWEREEMEDLLNEVRGHLGESASRPGLSECSLTIVVYSTRFLEQEDTAGQFLFQSDRILPLPIYD